MFLFIYSAIYIPKEVPFIKKNIWKNVITVSLYISFFVSCWKSENRFTHTYAWQPGRAFKSAWNNSWMKYRLTQNGPNLILFQTYTECSKQAVRITIFK